LIIVFLSFFKKILPKKREGRPLGKKFFQGVWGRSKPFDLGKKNLSNDFLFFQGKDF
jgi:hypothetical protein